MLNHRNSSAKQTKKSLSSFNSNRMSCSLLATGSGTEAAKRERRQGGSRGPGMAHPADLFYLEARGLGACHPHLLAGQKEHLQEGVGGEGPSCPKRCWRWAPGWARAGRRRHEGPHTHTHRQPQALHRELAGRVQLNWFFPLPPRTTELQNHIHQERQESRTEG